MAYLPLARKYRPQTFEDLVGQAHVTTTLSRSLEQKRLAQAYLFSGIRGVGKTSAARILAKAFNCVQGPTPKPCNTCPSCVQVTQGNSLDVTEIDGASNRGIDEIRSLRDAVPYAPTTGQFHVYIIDEVHMLTTEAFNALLKTLEEPPAHVKFIFATTVPTKVPATILSRCQRFDFRRIEVPEIVAQLARLAKEEKVKIDDAALYAIARAADGALRDAEVVLDQLASYVQETITEADVTELLGSVGPDALADLAQAILDRDAAKALSLIAQQRDRGKAAVEILSGLLWHMRNVMILASIQDAPTKADVVGRLVDESPERLSRLEEQASKASANDFIMMVQMLTGAFDLMRRTPMTHTVLELALLKLTSREPWQSLDAISRRLEALSQSGAAVASSVPVATPTAAASSQAAGMTPARPSAQRAQQLPRPFEPAARAPESSPEVAPPEPAAVPATPADPNDVDARWPHFMQRLGQTRMSLAAYLSESRPNRIEGDKFFIGLPGFALHQEVLSTHENRKLLEDLLKEVYGRDLLVRFETLAERSATPTGKASGLLPIDEQAPPALVQDIVKLFNATVINPPPKGS